MEITDSRVHPRDGWKREGRERWKESRYQWDVIHGVDYDTLILLSILGDTSEARLHHVITVQELLFGRRLQPHFELKHTIN